MKWKKEKNYYLCEVVFYKAYNVIILYMLTMKLKS